LAPLSSARRSSSATDRSREHWTALAAAARPKLAGLRFGRREIALREMAAAASVNPQTLRRALAALKFVETLEAEPFFKGLSLRAAPVAAIEHLARWHSYDRKAAYRAARLLSQGKFTVAALGAAEKAARAVAKPEGVGRALLHGCRLRVGPVLKAAFAALEMDDRADRRKQEAYVDFRFRPHGSTRWTIAAIIMGPYRDQRLYDTRLADWIVKALGLTMLYPRVILVVPTPQVQRRCRQWLAANAIDAGRFEIRVITREP
jgi:hypothetical protein